APWVADLTASKGVLYAVGTAPGDQGAIDYNLSKSSDGGANWDPTPIPVSFTPPSASVRLTPTTSVKLARGAHSTLVIASVNYTAHASSAAGIQPFIASGNDVTVLDPHTCKLEKTPTRPSGGCENPSAETHHPWSDFGVTQPELLHQQKALLRDDGGSWDTV